MPLDIAFKWIHEAANLGVQELCLSGGETMCYSHIYEIIKEATKLNLKTNIALSGWGLNNTTFDKLISSGVKEIYISLNGSNNKINSKSRDGYELAIKTLELLNSKGFKNGNINWVMHGSNADNFEDMIKLAEKYNIKKLIVMSFKPTSSHELPGLPTENQMRNVAKIIKMYKGSLELVVEGCFSQMRALVGQYFWGNMNSGIDRGCTAGIDSISVNVEGLLSPCRHLEYFEKYDSIKEYWDNSEILKKLRIVEEKIYEPCDNCKYKEYCKHCMAINAKMKGKIFIGNSTCPLS